MISIIMQGLWEEEAVKAVLEFPETEAVPEVGAVSEAKAVQEVPEAGEVSEEVSLVVAVVVALSEEVAGEDDVKLSSKGLSIMRTF